MKKVHINVGTIGHIDHGKTTLTAAILAVQAEKGFAKKKAYGDIAKGGTVRDVTKTVTITTSHVEYETDTRHYAHIDCPGHADYVKNMITGAAKPALDNPADPAASKCIVELMAALDSYIPNPSRSIDRPFLMPIEGVHNIEGRGCVVTGKIEQGTVTVGTKVEILGLGDILESVVTSVEAFNKQLEFGEAGQNVGLLLRGIKADQVERGQVVAQPRSIKPHTKFKSEIYVLGKDEGGRHTPIFNGYKPQFFFRTTNVTGLVQMPEGIELVMPGENTCLFITLDKPIAIEKGSHFAIREGGMTVGSGVVTELL